MNYELMVIFTPVFSEDDYKTSQKRYADFVTENGGKIVQENPWGMRSLAYPIGKKTTGMYWVLEYEAPSDFNDKLTIQLNRDEHVLRYLVTLLDKYAVVYNARRRKNTKAETQQSEA